MKTVLEKDMLCPHCGKLNDKTDAIGSEPRQPQAGDLTICIGCGEACEFTQDLTLQKLSRAIPPEIEAKVAIIKYALRNLRTVDQVAARHQLANLKYAKECFLSAWEHAKGDSMALWPKQAMDTRRNALKVLRIGRKIEVWLAERGITPSTDLQTATWLRGAS